MGHPHRVGIIGLGVISRAYLETLQHDPRIRITAVADLDAERAASTAAGLEHARALSVDDLCAADDVDTVLNLTIPAAHAEVAHRAIAGGKSVYGEKPLAATLDEARGVVGAGHAAGVGVWCAPDTVLGTGTQTARAVVARGAIGVPVGASATWASPGHEAWHPHPDFYYRQGGGPLMDMGPYYVTALCHLLGPVAAVTGVGSRRRAERTIATGPRAGERIPVDVDTHIVGVLEHVGGATSTITVSFDAAPSRAPFIEVFGEEGALAVPDPNLFDGEVVLTDARTGAATTLEAEAGYQDAARGVGLLDAAVFGEGRAAGDLALHVLEVMTGVLAASAHRSRVLVESRPTIPSLVPLTPASRWRPAR